MFTMLVCFQKYDNNDKPIDVQYHVFNNCKDTLEFIFDDIYRSFRDKGYLWSAIPFPELLAYECGFTISNVENKYNR